jgi:hypothetical protein
MKRKEKKNPDVFLLLDGAEVYYYTCVLILLYMCPHTTIFVSSYYYMCPHTTIDVSSYYYVSSCYHVRVLIPLYKCPHTTRYGSSQYQCTIPSVMRTEVHEDTGIPLHMCPHTTTYASSTYMPVAYTHRRTLTYVSSYYYICVLTLLYQCTIHSVMRTEVYEDTGIPQRMCPHTTTYASSH